MAVNRYYSNTAVATTLSSGINSSVTSIVVGSVSGFPVSFPYTLCLDRGTASEELVEVTAAVGTTLTVDRGADNTTAVTHSAGAEVEHTASAQDFREPQEHIDSTAAHGATGAVMGTTNTQTVTNKDMSSATNTFPNALNPVGVISLWGAAAAPTGWLLCDGSAVSRTTYDDLFAVIGTTYGTGDGSTTFNLPNLKGKVPVGRDSAQTEFDALGETGGAKTHTLTTSEMPSHEHGADTGGFAESTGTTDTFGSGGAARFLTTSTSATTGLAGGGGAHNNLQPYIVLNYIVKH